MSAAELAREAVEAAGGDIGVAITMLENAREQVAAGAYQ